MKTIYSFFVLLLITSGYLFCQAPQKVTIDNNKVSTNDISPELQLIFPDFRDGSIHYKTLRPIKCKLNYNFLLDEVLFLNEKGEHMAIANPEDLTYVIIENRKFIPSEKGYFEVIENDNISLLYKWTSRISKAGKEGALGLPTDAPSVYQMNRISFDSKEWKVGVNEEAVVYVEVRPYFKAYSKFIPATNPKSCYKAYPEKKALIRAYLEQNPVDFKSESDLRRLTRYCNSL